MKLQLCKSLMNAHSEIQITGSKSESNRLLILQALFGHLDINNLSNSDDTQVLQKALSLSSNVIDVHHAGTAMRFLTAYFAVQEEREVLLTGSSRMKERPIGILVDALRNLGADITYEAQEGYPPLKIKGRKLSESTVSLKANVSSQYISALLLIAGFLEKGLELKLDGQITSAPYINMTLSLLKTFGIETSFKDKIIKVNPLSSIQSLASKVFVVESDWSSASYFYSLLALSGVGTSITLSAYKENSLQGDSSLVEIYKKLGVETIFDAHTITLRKKGSKYKALKLKLDKSPDIAQTIAVTCFGLGIACELSGLHTLKIKETDRLVALKIELEKLGASVNITDDSLHLKASENIKENVAIDTYQDHRMAMAFAPLALKTSLFINEAEVVSKSYPDFWTDIAAVGIQINKI